MGVGPEKRVAIYLERGVAAVVSVLAVLKAGGAYLGLDTGHPHDRVRFMLDDCAPVAVITSAPLTSGLADCGPPVITVDQVSDQAVEDLPNIDPVQIGLRDDCLAYVVYTSGSTGKPKGVLVNHAKVPVLFDGARTTCGFHPNDVRSLFHSLSFDFSVWELWGAFLHGATLVVIPQALTRSPAELFEFLVRHRVTILSQTPSVFHQILSLPDSVNDCRHHLRLLVFAGELLGLQTVRRWFSRRDSSGTFVVNLYGATESTVHATIRGIHRDEASHIGFSNVCGAPMAGYTIHLLDEKLSPVSTGQPGDIFIGGGNLVRGYLNRPEETAWRFICDPFSSLPDARMYRTGDIGRWVAPGELEYLGRSDSQVKIRGFRIELGEVQAQLVQHPSIAEAAVIVSGDDGEEKRLVAYYVGKGIGDRSSLDETDLAARQTRPAQMHRFLSQRLPNYMVPEAFVSIDSLPLTSNGKLDTRALPLPGREAYPLCSYAVPVGPLEEYLAALWERLLNVPLVGRHDNFFKLGGSSISAVSLAEVLNGEGYKLDLGAIFDVPTVAQMASVLGRTPTLNADEPSLRPLSTDFVHIRACVAEGPERIQDVYPLTPLQQGILFHHLRSEVGDPYVVSGMLRFTDRLALEGYLSALGEVVLRHGVLRSMLLWQGVSEPFQIVLRRIAWTPDVVTLSSQGPAAQAELLERSESAKHRMDLREAPWFRVSVAEDRADSSWLMLFRLHHIAGDGETLRAIQAEIRAFVTGKGDALAPPQEFRDFVAASRSAQRTRDDKEFFAALLGDFRRPSAPYGILDIHSSRASAHLFSLRLEPHLVARIRGAARRTGVTHSSLLHVAWACVVARLSGQSDVTFGTVLQARNCGIVNNGTMLGPGINTLPFRLQVERSSIEHSVRAAQDLLGKLLSHAHAALTRVQDCSAVGRPAPLFTALLNCRRRVPSARQGDPWETVRELDASNCTNYPIALIVDDWGQWMDCEAQTHPLLNPMDVCGVMERTIRALVGALEQAPMTSVESIWDRSTIEPHTFA